MDDLIGLGINITGFASAYFGGLWLASHAMGWRRLVADYHRPLSPSAETLRNQSVYFGRYQYKSCLQIQLTADGLHFAMEWFYAFGHKPLMIPWSDIHFLDKGGLFKKWAKVEVPVSDSKPMILWLPMSLFSNAQDLLDDE